MVDFLCGEITPNQNKDSKTKNMSKLMLAFVLASTFLFSGCWTAPEEGTVEIQTIYGQYNRTIRPSDGGVWTVTTWGNEEYPVNLRAKQADVQVKGTSKDNAGLTLTIKVAYSIPDEGDNVRDYVTKFGMTDEQRRASFDPQLNSQVATAASVAINKYDAYALLANTEGIRQELVQILTPVFANQLRARLESVQIDGRPNFDDDRIEQAGSGVVAAKKKNEEEQALKLAALERNERLIIEAKTFENPKMYAIELQKLRVQEAQAWASHNGTLILGSGASPQIQIPSK